MNSIFVSFSPKFWTTVAEIAGVERVENNIVTQAGPTSGVTPFRAFRTGSTIIVLVEPTHSTGAFVQVFTDFAEFDAWREQHMHIDMGRRDI